MPGFATMNLSVPLIMLITARGAGMARAMSLPCTSRVEAPHSPRAQWQCRHVSSCDGMRDAGRRPRWLAPKHCGMPLANLVGGHRPPMGAVGISILPMMRRTTRVHTMSRASA